MKKFLFVLFSFMLFCICDNSFAKNSFFSSYNKMKGTKFCLTGFTNYPPFGYLETKDKTNFRYYSHRSVFDVVFKEFAQTSEVVLEKTYDNTSPYESFLALIDSGKCDIIIGAYYETDLYKRVSIIYPSLIINPVSIITLSDNAKNIKNVEQLKSLKGGIFAQDFFTDFVKEQMRPFNLIKENDPNKLFEKLFTGQIDYILATHYFGMIESIKLGIKNKLSFSKQYIWGMPMFLGVSKISPNRKYLEEKLSSYCKKADSKTKIENELRKIMAEFEKNYQGTVPPTYIKENKDVDKENSSEQNSQPNLQGLNNE